MHPDEPATEQQLSFLHQHGAQADHPLTRIEAAELIRQMRGDPADEAWRLRLNVDEANRRAAGAEADDLTSAQLAASQAAENRLEFWLDTCREATERHLGASQVWTLYQSHGCRFTTPTREQVHEVLEALDAAYPKWDLDHPALFYQTLELNFPELVKHR